MVGILLFTLGALNAGLALTVETCTQGSADSLRGGWLTLILYIGGSVALLANPPPRWAYLALIPSGAIGVWHSIFAAHFLWGYWFRGMSACEAMNGGLTAGFFTQDLAGESMDGGEPLLTALWATVSIVFWMAVITSFRLSALAAKNPSTK